MKQEVSVLERYPEYKMDIGIEVHVQLTTDSKVFSTADNNTASGPNEHITEICAGYPGVLPVFNEKVAEFAVMAGLALQCDIAPVSIFDRKHYFYPDLPKGYQITQDAFPICKNGKVTIRLEDGTTKDIRINRIHIEEDAGKNVHSALTSESFVDLNRAGTPLLEIVTEPDIENAAEAKAYLKALRQIVQYLGICTGNMEEGAFRADTNLSVRKKDADKLGTRCEMKNINSFKFISDAIEYEAERHIMELESGNAIIQQTRLWDQKNRQTKPMRSKEEAADYRYFEDPDLSELHISHEKVESIRSAMPELPYEKFARYIKDFGVSEYEADVLIAEQPVAHYFEQAMEMHASKSTVNWILRDVLGCVKEQKITIDQCLVTPRKLANLVQMLDNGTINNKGAQQIFVEIAAHGGDPEEIMERKGLKQIGSVQELEAVVDKVLADHPNQIEQYKAGKTNMFGFFVGTCMKATQGKGNPKVFQELLKKKLDA